MYEVRQRQRAGSYASDYLPIWAGLAERPADVLAGLQSMHSAGDSYILSTCASPSIVTLSGIVDRDVPTKTRDASMHAARNLGRFPSAWIEIAFLNAGLVHDGGFATSDMQGTGNQWDGSNAWPPIQSMLIEGLHTYGGLQGQHCAEVLAQSWLSSSYTGWQKYGKMVQPTCSLTHMMQESGAFTAHTS